MSVWTQPGCIHNVRMFAFLTDASSEYVIASIFIAAFDALYAQMPYTEISGEEYERLAPAFPAIDFSKLFYYEEEDLTTAAQELACLAGSCEVDYGVGQQQ